MPARTKPVEFLLPLAVLAFVGFWYHALSAPALPPAPASANIELQPVPAPNAPASYDRGTEKYPLIVAFADSQKARDQEKSRAALQQTEIINNQRIAMITALLVVIGCIQFLAMIIQAYWMKRWVQLGESGAGVPLPRKDPS